MNVMICGSRSICSEDYVFSKINEFNLKDVTVISGGAKGVDSIGEKWARLNNYPIKLYKPDWNKYGRGAGIVRNKIMIENSDLVLIFWDGKSKGTKNDIDVCKKLNKSYKLFLC